MVSIKGYLLVSIGSVLVFGGAFQSFVNIGAMDLVLWWGLVAVVGVFVLGFGTKYVVDASKSGETANPDKAVTKTDSRFGRSH